MEIVWLTKRDNETNPRERKKSWWILRVKETTTPKRTTASSMGIFHQSEGQFHLLPSSMRKHNITKRHLFRNQIITASLSVRQLVAVGNALNV